MIKHKVKFAGWFCLLTLVLQLCACGFKLQGFDALPTAFQSLALESDTPYDPFILMLRSDLIHRKINVVDDSQEAPYTLHVIHLNLDSPQTTITASQQARQFNITFSATFSLTNKAGKVVMAPISLSASQPITLLPNQLLSNTNQLTDIKPNLQRQVLNQLFDHLQAEGSQLSVSSPTKH